MKEKIFVTPGYSKLNKGDNAISSAVVKLIKRCIPDSAITFMSMYASSDLQFQEKIFYDIDKFDVEVVSAIFPYPHAKKNGKLPYLGTMANLVFHLARFLLLLIVAKISPNNAQHILDEGAKKTYMALLQSCVIIVKGGGFIYSFGMKGTISLFIWLHPLLLAKILKKPVVIFPQSIGPFDNTPSRILARFTLNQVNLIMVREKLSIKTLKELGVHRPKVVIVPDAAFALEIPPTGMGLQILTKEGIPETATLIGVTVRSWNFPNFRNPDELYKKYLTAMATAIQHLIEMNFFVVLVPQVTGPTDAENDLIPTETLADMVSDKKSHVAMIKGDYTPIELKALYGTMKLFIGTRMHSNIFALSMGIPTVAISYIGHKTHGIMDMLDIGEYVMDIDDVNERELIKRVDMALAEGEALSTRLTKKVSELKKKLERDACLINSIIVEKS